MIKVFKPFKKISVLFSLTLITLFACKKLVESPPPSEFVSAANVYSTDATAIAVLNGIYTDMNNGGIGSPFQGTGSINLLAGLSADELTLYNGVTDPTYRDCYNNSLFITGTTSTGTENWAPLYNYVFRCNAAIEGLEASKTLTPIVKQQLLGEAKFMRAFFYFYLVNLYGDLPLVVGTDPEINNLLSRSVKAKVYELIISDLKEAKDLLSDSYLSSTLLSNSIERVRPTKWAASALLARAYLFSGEYDKAESESSVVINNSSLFGPLPALNEAFIKNSNEAIWQIQPTAQYFNTTEAQALVIPAAGPGFANFVYLSKEWLSNFEDNDQRKVLGNWVNMTIYNISETVEDTLYYSYKYKKNLQDPAIVSSDGDPGYNYMTEYFMVLRLGEQYLIRAEARAQLDNVIGAQEDLNTIRTRAGLPNTTASDKTGLLSAILHERQVELFCEWGHRWFDLKRTGRIDEVMQVVTPLKSNGTVQWQPYQAFYPLPLESLQKALNLVQNEGY